MAGIRIEGLTRSFGAVRAVDDVTLEIADGDFLVLLGPSGCGKTTLLRMIAGLLPPTDGRIMLGDRDITHVPPRDRDLAMVFQSYALYPHLTVERNIGFPLRAARRPKAEIASRVKEVATQLELHALLRRRPRELSGGQRQRVALGRALVRDPRAFLMDEPLSNLDAKLRTATRTELSALHRRLGSTFVYVTHDQVEAMTMATRVALLNGGRLEQVGTPTEVYDTPASVFVAGFLGSPPMNLLDARIASTAGSLWVTADGVRIPLWAGSSEPRDVTLGLRPENLRLVPAGEADTRSPDGADGDTTHPQTPHLQGIVTAVENLGSEEVAWCSVGGSGVGGKTVGGSGVGGKTVGGPGVGGQTAGGAGGQTVAVRGPRPLGPRPGEAVGLRVDPDRVHLFDRASGRRLIWDATQPPTTAGDLPAKTPVSAGV